MFGGHGNGIVCSNDSININSHTGDKSGESNETGLIGTDTPAFDDFSTVTFGNGTCKKGKIPFSFFLFNFTGVEMTLPKSYIY